MLIWTLIAFTALACALKRIQTLYNIEVNSTNPETATYHTRYKQYFLERQANGDWHYQGNPVPHYLYEALETRRADVINIK